MCCVGLIKNYFRGEPIVIDHVTRRTTSQVLSLQ